jgi:hypothetical protein
LTQSLLERIAATTNACAAAKAREKQMDGSRKWKEIAASVCGGWLGIVLYIGLHSSPAVQDDCRLVLAMSPGHLPVVRV